MHKCVSQQKDKFSILASIFFCNFTITINKSIKNDQLKKFG